MTEQDLQDLPVGQLVTKCLEQQALAKTLTETVEDLKRDREATMHNVFNAIKASLTRAINDDVLEQDEAETIFDMFATRLNYEDKWTNPFAKKWTVKVRYNDDVVLVVRNVIADDAEDAISEVQDNLSVDDLTMTCKLSYSGDFDEDDVEEVEHESPDWEVLDDVKITAELAEA